MSETVTNRRDTAVSERDMTTSDFDRLLDRAVIVMREQANRPNPFALETWDEIVRFAEMASRTDMVPKDYKGKPDSIILVILQGKELGLPAIQSIQSIAMVNGRPSVWGDAVPGLCYSRGVVEDHQEYFDGTEGQDDFTAVCIVKRKGIAEPKTARFSQGDAKKAGLYGQNVHGKYPRRMMQWRARHSAFHDAFPDILRGIGTREIEAEDAVPTPGWKMPPPERGWFTTKPQARSDGWDDTWFSGAAQKLAGEPNAWKWMDVLIGCLADAPTKRDVDEIAELPQLETVLATAPDPAKKSIEDAFATAQSRFVGGAERKDEPAKAAAAQAPQAGAEVDSAGVAWDERVHASTKTKTADGRWRARRGADPAAVAQAPPASTPAADGGLFDTGTAPQQPAAIAQQTPAPTQPETARYANFQEWLTDGEGDPIPDEAGKAEAFTDPVAFAHAYVNARDSMPVADLALFESANHDGVRMAMAASNQVAKIIVGGKPEVRQDEPAGNVDRVPPPAKMVKADIDQFNLGLKAALEGAANDGAIKLIEDANVDTINGLPPKYRIESKTLIEARRKAISPAPAMGVAVNLTGDQLAETIVSDIASLQTMKEFQTWQRLPSAIAEVERVRREAPEAYGRVQAAISKRETELKVSDVRNAWEGKTAEQVYNDLAAQISAAKTINDLTAMQEIPSVIAGVQIVKGSSEHWEKLKAKFKDRNKELGG